MKPSLSEKGGEAFHAATSALPAEDIDTGDALFVSLIVGAAWIAVWIAWSLFSSYLSWAHQTRFQPARNLMTEAVFSAFVAMVLTYLFLG